MITYLPYPDIEQSVLVLDNATLRKQMNDTMIIWRANNLHNFGWYNHPAVSMWRDYDDTLAYYGYRVSSEWRGRGFTDSMLEWFSDRCDPNAGVQFPPWFNDQRIAISHRAALLRKDLRYYKQFFPDVDQGTRMFWPTHHEEYVSR